MRAERGEDAFRGRLFRHFTEHDLSYAIAAGRILSFSLSFLFFLATELCTEQQRDDPGDESK